MLLLLLVSPLLFAAAGLTYQLTGERLDRARFPPPGRLVPTPGTRLHLYETGETSSKPAIVLEAGIAGSLLGWGCVQPAISGLAQTISYDRAGLGWSGAATEARTVPRMIEELHGLLEQSSAQPPYVLVGHSFGGLLVRAYAARWPEQVAGLILVDPVSVASWSAATEPDLRRLWRGAALARRGAILARFGVVRAALTLLVAGGRRIPQLIGRAAARDGQSTLERLVGEVSLLPSHSTPIIRSHWSAAKCFRAMASYLECLPDAAREVSTQQIPAHIPLTVLSAQTATPAELAERDLLAARSVHGVHTLVPDCGHWIQIRRPDTVIEAVRQMLTYLATHRDLV